MAPSKWILQIHIRNRNESYINNIAYYRLAVLGEEEQEWWRTAVARALTAWRLQITGPVVYWQEALMNSDEEQ